MYVAFHKKKKTSSLYTINHPSVALLLALNLEENHGKLLYLAIQNMVPVDSLGGLFLPC
jgi:hypothetical protein